jgi:hypothetical protein
VADGVVGQRGEEFGAASGPLGGGGDARAVVHDKHVRQSGTRREVGRARERGKGCWDGWDGNFPERSGIGGWLGVGTGGGERCAKQEGEAGGGGFHE